MIFKVLIEDGSLNSLIFPLVGKVKELGLLPVNNIFSIAGQALKFKALV
jgi:hypothetical protein